MKIGSISENLNSEKRISITPEVANKYINLGLEVCLNSNYGSHLGFDDRKYKELKVEILNDSKDVIKKSDLMSSESNSFSVINAGSKYSKLMLLKISV